MATSHRCLRSSLDIILLPFVFIYSKIGRRWSCIIAAFGEAGFAERWANSIRCFLPHRDVFSIPVCTTNTQQHSHQKTLTPRGLALRNITSKLDYTRNQISRCPFRKIRFQKCEIRFYNSTLTFTAIVRLLPHFLHFSHVLNDETIESDFVLA